jgi:hypothetical protein
MNLPEPVIWIMLGFVLVLRTLSISWKIVEKFKSKVEKDKKVAHTNVL